MALEQRMKTEAERTGFNLARLRKRVAFELFLNLAQVAPDRWVLKGALALDFRLGGASRSTKDIDLGRDDNEEAAIEDIAAAQRLRLDDFFTFMADQKTTRSMRSMSFRRFAFASAPSWRSASSSSSSWTSASRSRPS